jgi:hypothetical protein
MSARPAPETPPAGDPTEPSPVPPRSRHPVVRAFALFLTLLVVVLAVALVTSLSVDLGPALRERAEKAGTDYLKRRLTIGRLSVRLLTGSFIVEDLQIAGLEPAHRPFLKARRIEVSMPLAALIRRELLFESIVMDDWQMLVESWPDGRHSFPRFARGRSGGPKRFVTTVKLVHASQGQFTYEDHGVPWRTIARNLDVRVTKGLGYGGTATFRDGSVGIQRYRPMRADMQSRFTIDGSLVRFSRIDLITDGAVSRVHGVVDLGRWPEQTWQVQSDVDFVRMREIFFARERWRVSGHGDFTGTFHLFKGGRELKGTFASARAAVNQHPFERLRGSLLWIPRRFEVTNATAEAYGGTARFSYVMAPLGTKTRARARFDATYEDVDIGRFADAMNVQGIQLLGHGSGRNVLDWPLGRFADVQGEGRLVISPPPGAEVLGGVGSAVSEDRQFGREWGPFSPHVLGASPVGAQIDYRFDPQEIVIGSSRFATRRTYVEFEGRTAWGEQSHIPFHVTSADWQESDRLLAAMLTAFGSRSSAVPVGGWGEFDGVMTKSFRRPRVEGQFKGEELWAWNVVWGSGWGHVVIEDSYVTVTDSVLRRDGSELSADGRFSLGYPRRDGGEQINARVRLSRRPVADLRRAFGLMDYPVEGRLTGEFHLYGDYEGPLGYGRMEIVDGMAYGEPFAQATASLRFEGTGVRLDGIDVTKGDGTITGAAFVGWDGTYSFNATGQRLSVESLAFAANPQLPLSGQLEFTASGSGEFESPRYDVRLGVSDLFVADEGIGEVTGRLTVRNTTLTVEVDAASPRLSVSGTGRIALTPESDADLTFRFTDTSLDPYVRTIQPRLSPFTTAVVSGSIRIAGELRNREHLLIEAVVEDAQLRLFDYRLRNDGALRLTLEGQQVNVSQLRLVGEGTRLEVTGGIPLSDGQMALHATGAANLGILQGFFRDIRSSGQADLEADVTGSLREPRLAGSASIAGGRIRHFALPHSLEAVNGRLTFDGTGARLDGLTARLGGGLVQFGGRIGLEGYTPSDLNITASGQDMRIRYPAGFRSVIDADLSLRGPLSAPVLGGEVLVKSSVLSRRFNANLNWLEFAGTATASSPGTAAPSGIPLRFEVHVLAPSSLRVENNVARIVSSADLTLRGTYDRPLLFGRAEIERGEVVFEGRRYLVTRGTIDFSNPTRIEPFFDIQAETRVRVPGQTYQVSLNAVGTFARFQYGLNSDPALSEVDILSILLGNTAPTDPELARLRAPDTAEQQLLQARAAQLLVSPLSASVGRVVEQTFGVDSFQITPSLNDPSQQSSRFNPGARLTIGKRISGRVYLTFSQSLTPSSTSRDQVILLEYDQSDRLSWLLSQNEDRTYALEARVRHSF